MFQFVLAILFVVKLSKISINHALNRFALRDLSVWLIEEAYRKTTNLDASCVHDLSKFSRNEEIKIKNFKKTKSSLSSQCDAEMCNE